MPSHQRGDAFESLSSEQQRILAALDVAAAEYIVVGGYAVRAHGYLRETDDLDLLVNCTTDNVAKLRQALEAVGAARVDDAIELLQPARRAVVRWENTDLLSIVGSYRYADVARGAVSLACLGRPVRVLSLEHLIEAKRQTAGRAGRNDKKAVDADDADVLEALRTK